MQSEELHEEELNRFIKEENGCDEKNVDVPEGSDTGKNFTLKEFSEIFYKIESTKDKIL